MLGLRGRVKEKILELLSKHKNGLRQADIVRVLNVSRSYVSEVMKEFVRRGIVKKIIDSGITKYVLVERNVEEEEKPRILRIGFIWSSEYPFLTYFCKNLKIEENIHADALVYSNALDATWDLVNNKIHLVLSPVITQFLYGTLTKNIVIIAGGASGGAGLYINKSCNLEIGISSQVSTMDLMLTYTLKELGVTDYRKYYGLSGDEVFMAIASCRARYAALWEPLATRLERMGFKREYSLDDIGLPHCCTLAVSRRIPVEYRSIIRRHYVRAIEEFVRKPDNALGWYSLKTGIPVTLLKDTIKSYTYKPYIELKETIKTLHKIGLSIPYPDTLVEYIEQ